MTTRETRFRSQEKSGAAIKTGKSRDWRFGAGHPLIDQPLCTGAVRKEAMAALTRIRQDYATQLVAQN